MIESAESIQQIERRIKDVHGLTAWSPVPSGSVLRVHAYSYPAWGILITPENSEWLYTHANLAYSVEWKDTDQASNRLVAQASINAGLSDVNGIMNGFIGDYAAAIAYNSISLNGKFLVIDVGAGVGSTTLAFLNSFYSREGLLSQNDGLVLIEPSEKRQKVARDEIKNLVQDNQGKDFEVPLSMISETDVVALSEMRSGCADLVIQNASIHHNAFNVHLQEINRVLKPGGHFISGDWHNSMWETPARTYWLLYLLQKLEKPELQEEALDFVSGKTKEVEISDKCPELREFRKYFYLDDAAIYTAFNGLETKEKQANAAQIKFWLEVGKLFAEKQERSSIFFLESHERVSRRLLNLVNARFVFDEECREKYQEVLRAKGKGELATVMVAKKRC